MKEWSGKDDQKKKDINKKELNDDFLKLSYDEDLNRDKIKYFFENDFEIEERNIDKLIREKIERFELQPENNTNILEELFLHADLNYVNSDYKNSNLIMGCCQKAEPEILSLFLDVKYHKRKKKLIEIDLFGVDKNNSNILHYLFNQTFEVDISQNFEKIMRYYKNNCKKDKAKFDLLTKEDKDGITPLSMILRNGWYETLEKYFNYFDYKPHIIFSSKNNNIHCAIEGKNVKCLKLILGKCSAEELNQTNINNLTPINFAKEKKYYYMVELIKQFTSNSATKEFKDVLLVPKIDTDEIIKLLSSRDFKQVENFLSKYKISQTINNSSINTKNINLSYEWNLLLTKKYEILNRGITPENILSKYVRGNNIYTNKYQNKINIISTLLEFNTFFEKYINALAIKDHIDEENYPIDIIIYNRIIYHYKISDFDNFLKYVNLYFTHIYPQQENNFLNRYINSENSEASKYDKIRVNFYKYITYVNISFLLVEFFIKEKNEQFSQIILDELEKYFSEINISESTIPKLNQNAEPDCQSNDQSTNDSTIDEDNYYLFNCDNKIETIEYLNKNEILHPLNITLDDSLFYLYLLEIYYVIKFNYSKSESFRKINKLINSKFNLDNKKEKENYEKDEEEDEDEEGENDYNNIFDNLPNNNNKINLKNLNKVSILLKDLNKSMKNNYDLNKNFENKYKIIYFELQTYLNNLLGNNIESIYNINESKLVSNIKTHEQKIFCYNSQGIINLKLKKYVLAKHFFKLGINLYKSIHNNLNTSNSIYYNDTVINKNEYLYKMEFNLGLACFYNGNYLEAFDIYNKLKGINDYKNNAYLWFRLGLCALNLYLISIRKLKQQQRKYYQNLNKNIFENNDDEDNEEQNIKYFTRESSSNDSVDELIEEYKKLYGINDEINIENNNDLDNNRLIKIFLEPNNIQSHIKNNSFNNYNNSLEYEPEEYLNSTILAFKKVLNIYKKYNNINEQNMKKKEDLKGIYNFYTKNIGETKEFKSMLNNQILNKNNSLPKNLIFSCYLNLLFAYNLNKKYLDMILLIKSIKKEKALPKNISRKIKYYELLSLINLNKNKQASELISEEINKYGNIDSDANNDFDCFNLDDFQIEKDFNHKIYMNIGKVFIQCKNKDWAQGYDTLMDIIKNNFNRNEDISRYYYKLMIYILSCKNNSNKIVKLLKYRWNQIQNNMNNKKNNG